MEKRGRQKDRGKGLGNHGNSRKGIFGKKGHMKKDCRAPKKQRDGQQKKNQEANITGDVLQDAFIISVDNIS